MKLAAIALSFMIPLVVTTYFLVNEQNIKIDFAEQELRGDRYLRPLSQLLVHVELPSGAACARATPPRRAAPRRSSTRTSPTLLAVDRELRDALETTSAALNARRRGSAVPVAPARRRGRR